MGCGGCSPRRNSPEFRKFFKPENNSGCGGGNSGCDSPSKAMDDSPLAKWESIYGKIVTSVTFEQDETGRYVTKIVKKPCPIKPSRQKNMSCCSLRYKFVR